MPRNAISPTAVLLTLLLHVALLYLAMKHFPHHHLPPSKYNVVHVSIPVSVPPPPVANPIDIQTLTVPVENLNQPDAKDEPADEERYYLPNELSQQVHVLEDTVSTLDIPIRRSVTMTLYINEAGGVDEAVIDDKGILTEEEQKQLISGFERMLFLPGMRGEKVVKSIYQLRLEVNRKLIIQR